MTRRFREKILSSSSEKTVDLAIDRRESSDVVVKILTMVCALRFATQGACFRENCRYAHDAAEGAAVPEHQGVLSTTYSIEVVDW